MYTVIYGLKTISSPDIMSFEGSYWCFVHHTLYDLYYITYEWANVALNLQVWRDQTNSPVHTQAQVSYISVFILHSIECVSLNSSLQYYHYKCCAFDLCCLIYVVGTCQIADFFFLIWTFFCVFQLNHSVCMEYELCRVNGEYTHYCI